MTKATKEIPDSPALELGPVVAFSGNVELAAKGGGEGPRSFRMKAYTGRPVHAGVGFALVVDLDGLQIGRQKKPALVSHDNKAIAGYTTKISREDGDGIVAEGKFSVVSPDAARVVALADEGFPWQSSIQFEAVATEYVPRGESMEVNGRAFKGPGVVVTKSRLREISFTPTGADDGTSAVVFEGGGAVKVAVKGVDTMSGEDTNAVVTVEAFEKSNADQVAAWKEEGRKAGVKEGEAKVRGEFAAMVKNFGDKPEYIIESFSKGLSASDATDGYIESLRSELAASKETVEELSKEQGDDDTDGHPGVATKLASGTKPKADSTEKLSVEELAKKEWAEDKDGIRAEFSSEAGYVRYCIEEARVSAK